MKFFVKDEEGNKFEVEQVEETKKGELVQPETKDEVPPLSDEEILALRNLASRANEIIKLLEVEENEHNAVEEEIGENDSEEMIDTDDETEEIVKKAADSKKSIGATIMKKSVVADSIDADEEINSAWAKYYGGKK